MKPEKKRWLELMRTEPYKIGHWLGFEDLNTLHNDWIKSFLFDNEDQTLLAHRGSYKTTCLAIALAILIVIKPKETIIFVRKTDTDVIEIIKQITKALESPVFKRMVKDLYGEEIILTTASVSEINTNLNISSRGTSQLIGMGVFTSITGKHADVVVTDDIVNVKDRLSRAERDRTKSAYMELQNIKNRGGRFINTGTPWHKEDVIKDMPNQKRFDCYSTGLMNTDEIRYLQSVMTPSLFAANYELKHIANEDAMFKNPNYTKDITLLYNGIAQIDAAYGGEDSTAFTIGKKQGNDFIVFGKKWRKHVDDCMTEILYYHREYRAGTIYNEYNADKGYLNKQLKESGIMSEVYHENENKYMKIATTLRSEWGNIYFVEGTDPEYISEILDYTENAQHDDAPDSLASLIRIMKHNSNSNFNDTYRMLRKGLGR